MPEPRYRQIADVLRQMIESGELGPGAQLPTELELRERHDASRNTVRDAVKLLITRGLVETRPGQGTFVVEKIDPFVTPLDLETGRGDDNITYASLVAARRRIAKVTDPSIGIHQANQVVASRLGLPKGSLVVSRRQERYIDGTPWSLQTSYYPMRYVDAGARRLIEAVNMPDGVIRYLEDELGIKQVGWRDIITVRAPETVETAFFKLPDDGRVAVFETFRVAYERSGSPPQLTPLRLTITVYPTDRNQFVMSVGEVPADVVEVADADASLWSGVARGSP